VCQADEGTGIGSSELVAFRGFEVHHARDVEVPQLGVGTVLGVWYTQATPDGGSS
jgi:hypothetical protein